MTLQYFDKIQYGPHQDLEVLVAPDTRELWVTQPVIERLLGWPANTARKKLRSKALKEFAGKDLTLGKTVPAKDIAGRVNKFTAVPFDTFLTVVYWQAIEKDDAAIRLLIAGFADSFSSIILEQCGIKVTVAERQTVVSFYLTKYHEYQDWIRDTHLAIYGRKPDREYYRDIAIAINQALFERWSFNSDRLANATTEELRELEIFERFAIRQVKKFPGGDPLEVTKSILEIYC